MGRPVDRAEGVVLITDYGTADQLMSDLKRKRGEKNGSQSSSRRIPLRLAV